jgi:hypothetical protein
MDGIKEITAVSLRNDGRGRRIDSIDLKVAVVNGFGHAKKLSPK